MKPLDGPPGTTADFTDLHAWCEVYLPGAGWIGLDPTSGLLAGEGHIPLSCTPEPASAAPISGARRRVQDRRSSTTMQVTAHLRIAARHQAVHRRTVERDRGRWATPSTTSLRRLDVRLTMGGEPTFVSVDDRDGAEWNTAALGPTKRAAGGRSARAAPGSLRVRTGSCTSARASGTRASSCRAGRSAATGAGTASRSGRTTALIADERRDYGYTARDAERFIRALTRDIWA